ncbi:MAG: DMT family transporter [Cytophagales bacterium]|nr:DMT family transporter [Cytophagales bacterium]
MKNVLLALGYAFCWGIGVTLTKMALSGIAPTPLLITQLSSGVLFLLIVCYVQGEKLPVSWPLLKKGYAGVFEPALAYMVGIFGIRMTTASSATLIGASEVILTILFAAIFLSEKLSHVKLSLAAISFGGLWLLMLGDMGDTRESSFAGDLLVLLGVVFAVLYTLISKKQVATISPQQLAASQQLVGLIVTVTCFGVLSFVFQGFEISFHNISPGYWLLAIGSGIIQYALAFLLYLIALKNIPVSRAAFYIALIPVFGVASAVVMIGEQPGTMQWVGGLLIVGSSYFANRLSV